MQHAHAHVHELRQLREVLAWLGVLAGMGTSTNCSTSVPPHSLICTAFMVLMLPMQRKSGAEGFQSEKMGSRHGKRKLLAAAAAEAAATQVKRSAAIARPSARSGSRERGRNHRSRCATQLQQAACPHTPPCKLQALV